MKDTHLKAGTKLIIDPNCKQKQANYFTLGDIEELEVVNNYDERSNYFLKLRIIKGFSYQKSSEYTWTTSGARHEGSIIYLPIKVLSLKSPPSTGLFKLHF